MTRHILLAVASAMVFSNAAFGEEKTTTKHGDSMKITLKVGDRALTATLIDNKTTRNFFPCCHLR